MLLGVHASTTLEYLSSAGGSKDVVLWQGYPSGPLVINHLWPIQLSYILTKKIHAESLIYG